MPAPRAAITVALAFAAAAAPPPAVAQVPVPHPVHPDFADATEHVPGLVAEMRYFGSDNFVGRPIAGYEAPVCLLTRQAVAALASVQARLAPFGLGLKVFDCYRPAAAVADFVRWAGQPADTARKADYYPDIDKDRLFELGYIAERSGHSRGSTVDLTIIDRATGAHLDMGTHWDMFSPRSWPTEPSMTPSQRANRLLLQRVMHEAGFRHYEREWWHFTLGEEPFPETWFEFPVARPGGR